MQQLGRRRPIKVSSLVPASRLLSRYTTRVALTMIHLRSTKYRGNLLARMSPAVTHPAEMQHHDAIKRMIHISLEKVPCVTRRDVGRDYS